MVGIREISGQDFVLDQLAIIQLAQSAKLILK
jgi:hypothetical protein